MNKKVIHLIVAARPNFVKIAPLYYALDQEDWAQARIIHTGQHYDLNMSNSFFKDLDLPEPHLYLGVGSGTHAEQTGRVMMAYEKELIKERPDLVVVVGDVNSTLATTLAAVKLGIKVGHLEAGLRSFDRTMPEEINRIVTDSLADIHWTPSPDADKNLTKEGIKQNKIKRVGNIMIDTLELLRDKIENEDVLNILNLKPQEFAIVTIHRPSNVDERIKLGKVLKILLIIAKQIKILFPIHPRTRKRFEEVGLFNKFNDNKQLIIIEPQSYVKFMNLVFNSRFVITDSGGIQEETTYLGIPCLTMRENTERPITISQGTNQLCNLSNILKCVGEILKCNQSKKPALELWDGQTAKRVVKDMKDFLKVNTKCSKH
jgi:UDP-N-acetylglucosamine 2-epimerase (non-hydrolysing)